MNNGTLRYYAQNHIFIFCFSLLISFTVWMHSTSSNTRWPPKLRWRRLKTTTHWSSWRTCVPTRITSAPLFVNYTISKSPKWTCWSGNVTTETQHFNGDGSMSPKRISDSFVLQLISIHSADPMARRKPTFVWHVTTTRWISQTKSASSKQSFSFQKSFNGTTLCCSRWIFKINVLEEENKEKSTDWPNMQLFSSCLAHPLPTFVRFVSGILVGFSLFSTFQVDVKPRRLHWAMTNHWQKKVSISDQLALVHPNDETIL